MKQSDHLKARQELGFPINFDVEPRIGCNHYWVRWQALGQVAIMRCAYCLSTKPIKEQEQND